jgi:hypothetical protein
MGWHFCDERIQILVGRGVGHDQPGVATRGRDGPPVVDDRARQLHDGIEIQPVEQISNPALLYRVAQVLREARLMNWNVVDELCPAQSSPAPCRERRCHDRNSPA